MVYKTKQVEFCKSGLVWFLCMLALPVVGYWHVWRWYVNRVANSLEEVIGLLVFAVFLVVLSAKSIIDQRAFYRVPLIPLIIMLLAYSLSYLLPVPPIFRAAIALLMMFLIIYRFAFPNWPPVSFWGLILISLPVVPSLQFYLGYPVRYVSAYLTVPLLRLNGISVSQDGTNLLWSDQVLQFDAPCSGVTMLWAGLFFSLFMSLVYRFNLIKTILAVVFSSLLVLAGNVVRASSLFYLEIGAIPFEGEWLHEGIGSATYALVVACIVVGLSRYQCWVQVKGC